VTSHKHDGGDLAEVAAAIVAAWQVVQRPADVPVKSAWKSSGQIAPTWGDVGRRAAWKDVDRGRGWRD
jgi:hypothetical protein